MPPNTLSESSANVRYLLPCFIAAALGLKRRPADHSWSRNYHRPQASLSDKYACARVDFYCLFMLSVRELSRITSLFWHPDKVS